jgi:hypothetical protein
MRTIPITEDQAEFIKANYKTMSMRSMSEELHIPIPRVRKFMKSNELTVSRKEMQAIKEAKFLENQKNQKKSNSGKYIPFQWMPY